MKYGTVEVLMTLEKIRSRTRSLPYRRALFEAERRVRELSELSRTLKDNVGCRIADVILVDKVTPP